MERRFRLNHPFLALFSLIWLLSACIAEPPTGDPVSQVTNVSPTPSEVFPACIQPQTPETGKVLSVIDGDTILVRMGKQEKTIRYLGMDTPEMDAKDPRLGRLASKRNKDLVEGETITLLGGETDQDEFGRYLRFVFIDSIFVNQVLVQEGLATSFNRPHDSACADLFTEGMLTAYRNNLGIWKGVDSAVEQGESLCPEGCEYPPKMCQIKGNITFQDDYIYHLPSSPDYADVKMQPEKGERWFCTLDEAISNGWRPPRQE
jgi:endonuclease YncB( thermonuclease family)